MKRTLLIVPPALIAGILAVVPARAADRPAPPAAPAGDVEEVKDLAYYDGKDADPEKHRLDLYLPKGRKDFPVLFFVHGGAWRSGDKRQYAPLGRLFARQGLGTVIINYRLSPKVQFPAHIQDVARAFGWTHANISKYGGRPDEIVISGHSAGGHLVALLATDESYLKAEKLSRADIRAVVALSGVYLILPPLFRSVFGKDDAAYKSASPLQHVGPGEPPFLIVYADRDFPTCGTVSERMCRALKDCKCDAASREIKDRDHISIIRRMAQADDPATQALLDFVARHTSLKRPTGAPAGAAP
jgi:dipeptidyl aminopeptidase/acylaminoacyl peptidase